MESEKLKMLENVISPDDFNSMDEQKQAEALMRLLLLAGMDESRDFEDEELLTDIKKIITNFDPQAPIDESETVFEMQMMNYQKQTKA